jgi:PAS domain S-box-containing protein
MSRRSARLLDDRPVAVIDRLRGDTDVWRLALNSLTARVAVLDELGNIVAVNDAWQSFAWSAGGGSGYVGANYIAVCEASSDPIAPRLADGLRDVASGRIELFECEYASKSQGQERWSVVRAKLAAHGSVARFVVSHEDVTERRLSQNRARSQSLLLNEVNVAVHTTDLSRVVQSWNAGAEQLFGWTAEEAIGRHVHELIVASDMPIDPEIHRRIGAGEWEGDVVLARRNGATFPAHVRSRVVGDLTDGAPSIVVVTMDISERVRYERELELARDHLRAVTGSLGEGMFTVDTTGRVTYMNPAAEVQLGWTAAELHGRDLHQITHSRRRDGSPLPVEECQIMRACHEHKVVDVDDDVFITANGTELDVAYTASPFATDQDVEGCVIVFRDVTARNADRRRLELEVGKLATIRRIREAPDDDGFVLFDQPIVELNTGKTVQRELLIRMRDPESDGGVIAPGAFLPVAEEFGLIVEIDRWVIDQAAELAASGCSVEINVSGVSIGDPGLLKHITAALERSGADPRNLVFEITETTLVEDESAGRSFVERLHELGCGVALDDFGTGYGGFTYLKQLPIDIVKIDIEFVRDLTVSVASQNVVEAIVNLARRFGVLTVAEGVEDEETLALLRNFGVDHAQGYHCGRPAPITTSGFQKSEELAA